VARLGVALAKGLEAGRVASCVKHFPGHGDTSQDSHMTLPRLAHDRARRWQVELVPFVAAARAGLASVMTAHVRFEAFDRLPATLSPAAMKLLREDVAFRGACISDDLEMKAIADTYGVIDGAELALAAGVDAVLVCHTLELQHHVIESIARGANAGPLSRDRLAEEGEDADQQQRSPQRSAARAFGRLRRRRDLRASRSAQLRLELGLVDAPQVAFFRIEPRDEPESGLVAHGSNPRLHLDAIES